MTHKTKHTPEPWKASQDDELVNPDAMIKLAEERIRKNKEKP